MDVNSTVVTESTIKNAQSQLSRAYRFGGLNMRSCRTIQGRGLRLFEGIGMNITTCGLS